LELQTDVTLPVRQIRDANLAWVRDNPGPRDDNDLLLRSLRKRGMVLPILLTTELVVADGARRLLRAERLGWREVAVVVTTDWDVVRTYYANAKKLEVDGKPHEPMTWAEIVDLVAGPLDLLYRTRRRDRGRQSRAAAAQRRAAGLPALARQQRNQDVDYVGEAAEVLGWRRSDLRAVREAFWALKNITAHENAEREAAYREGGAEAANKVPRQAEMLHGEVKLLETDGGGNAGGLHTLLKKLRWAVAGHDPSLLKVGPARRRVGEPTFTERRARAATDPSAVGREMDAQTLTRLTQLLTTLGNEFDEYTHVRPSVRVEEARTAAKDIKGAVNQINRLTRLVKAHADYLEESS
jgi:hypothetical protein